MYFGRTLRHLPAVVSLHSFAFKRPLYFDALIPRPAHKFSQASAPAVALQLTLILCWILRALSVSEKHLGISLNNEMMRGGWTLANVALVVAAYAPEQIRLTLHPDPDT